MTAHQAGDRLAMRHAVTLIVLSLGTLATTAGAGSLDPDHAAGPAGATAPGPVASAASGLGPDGASTYARDIAAAIRRHIVYADEAADAAARPLSPVVEVEVRTEPGGRIAAIRLLRASGVEAWDQAVLQAIERTASLPLDGAGRVPRVMVLNMRPR